MAQENKFDYSIKQDGDKWGAEIIRRVTARRTSVSKQKKGFETQELAEQWAKETLVGYLENLQAGNKRKSEKRAVRNELAAKAEAEKQAASALYEEKRLAAFEEDDIEE
ncbi:MAG: hypothetical protein ACJAT7_001131 [Psychromonas sp.]|jgi:hypothetical protein|uniref:DUF3622 domain-containing protein n=1 Tax=Psychromonas sp. TaxID=1884585 RepID=UPI0039E37D44